MFHRWPTVVGVIFIFSTLLAVQKEHTHDAPEKLGNVSFPISCGPSVQRQFDRGIALLHSFAYAAAENAFRSVAEGDSRCAMAHWGVAMTYFHPLWDPSLPPTAISIVQQEIERAQQIDGASERERGFIRAVGLLYQDAATVPYGTRLLNYEHAMRELAADNTNDVEAQVFYALALLANASPTDKTHGSKNRLPIY